MRRGLVGLIGLIMVIAASGATYNMLALRHLRNSYPPPGKFYTVEGHRMHVSCTGSGSPAVVLESGLAEGFLVWGKVQPALSRVTRVCSYDRAGLGWSESVPGPRDSRHIADQLHALLSQAHIDGPLVLVGHSAGGLYIRAYATRFTNDVVGMVFVDASTPGQENKLPASVAALDQHGTFQIAVFQTMIALGIPRILGQCETPPPGFEATANLWRANACAPAYVTAFRRESDALPQSMAQAARTSSYGNLPIMVVSQDPNLPRPRQLPATVSASDWQLGITSHDAMQQDLLHLSIRSRRIIAKGSRHYIHFDRPQLLVREVSTFIQHIRSGDIGPENGTTVTE
ncbi:MAG: alpha/beta hydrolase [Rhodanobacteraceae bacterium]